MIGFILSCVVSFVAWPCYVPYLERDKNLHTIFFTVRGHFHYAYKFVDSSFQEI